MLIGAVESVAKAVDVQVQRPMVSGISMKTLFDARQFCLAVELGHGQIDRVTGLALFCRVLLGVRGDDCDEAGFTKQQLGFERLAELAGIGDAGSQRIPAHQLDLEAGAVFDSAAGIIHEVQIFGLAHALAGAPVPQQCMAKPACRVGFVPACDFDIGQTLARRCVAGFKTLR